MVGTSTNASEIGLKNFHSIFFVTTVNDTQRGGGIETSPVGGGGDPRNIILEEGIVGCVGVHDSVGPDGGTMKGGGLWANCFFDLVNQLDISVVVFLKELKIKSFTDVTFEDGTNLVKSGLDLTCSIFGLLSDDVENVRLISLVLFFADVEGYLIGV